MPRPHRPDLHGAWYHVINRGADRQDVFSCDADFAYFETLMADAVATHGIQIHAYSLMDNHFHQLIHCPEGGLSAAMKDIQSVYVGSYNHHHERTGPMFEGRFTSRLVDGSAALHLTGRYIHRNPLDIVPSHSLAHYRWSSFRHYASGSVAPNWLTTSELDGQFQDHSTYERYVLTSHPSDKQAERLGSPAALGRLDALDEHVAAICGVAVDNLRLRNLDNTARLLAQSRSPSRPEYSGQMISLCTTTWAAPVRCEQQRGEAVCDSPTTPRSRHCDTLYSTADSTELRKGPDPMRNYLRRSVTTAPLARTSSFGSMAKTSFQVPAAAQTSS